jgi:single-stranded-DNA-specific exonuclease
MSLRWNLRAHDARLIQEIERHSNVSPVVAQLLSLRGITRPHDVNLFLETKMTGLRPPQELPGVSAAVDIIFAAIEAKQKIFVYGDYDADGMTSTAILYLCLQLMNADVSYFVPNRLDDGYGLSSENLSKLQQRGAELIITVDCGIASVEEVEHANKIGLPVIITDHHHVGNILPSAAAIVHPGLPNDPYPFPGLCGAGVAFKLAWALCQRKCGSPKLPESLRNFLFRATSLAAIGTVCDVVPLLDENRIIVHHGVKCLRTFANPGLNHLMAYAKIANKPELNSGDIGFMLGPRLNAAGRLGQAQLGVELLICEDEERGQALATHLDELNKNRDSLDRKILKSAKALIAENFDPENDPALVVAEKDWHLGVIGIAAGRVAQFYHRPTVLLSIDILGNRPAVGSARSACGVNLYDAIAGASAHVIKFGGHAAAAGLSVEPNKIDDFREEFFQQVIDQVSVGELVPDLDIDAEALIGQITVSMINDLEKLAPFGQSNPRPVLCATDVKLAEEPKTMGTDGRHLSLRLRQNDAYIRAVAFGKGEWAQALKDPDASFDFAFEPMINDFRGRKSAEVKLIDFRPTVA